MYSTVPVVDRLVEELHKDRPWVVETMTFAEAVRIGEQNQ